MAPLLLGSETLQHFVPVPHGAWMQPGACNADIPTFQCTCVNVSGIDGGQSVLEDLGFGSFSCINVYRLERACKLGVLSLDETKV